MNALPDVCAPAPLWAVAEAAPPRLDPHLLMASMTRPPALQAARGFGDATGEAPRPPGPRGW